MRLCWRLISSETHSLQNLKTDSTSKTSDLVEQGVTCEQSTPIQYQFQTLQGMESSHSPDGYGSNFGNVDDTLCLH